MSAGKSEEKKGRIALLAIGLSVAALVLGMLFRAPVMGTFSPGTLVAFFAFMLSLGSVKDHGSNAVPMIAFWVSFSIMVATIFMSL